MAMCFLNLCTGACAPVYLRLPGDGNLALQHVAVFKTYTQFAILLCEFVCDVIYHARRSHQTPTHKYEISVFK